MTKFKARFNMEQYLADVWSIADLVPGALDLDTTWTKDVVDKELLLEHKLTFGGERCFKSSKGYELWENWLIDIEEVDE